MNGIHEFFEEKVRSIFTSHPLLNNAKTSPVRYGTAGFRCEHKLLPPISARVMLIAMLRSILLSKERSDFHKTNEMNIRANTQHYLVMGVMVTASHNPFTDNGMKLIDCGGEMLNSLWEPWCTRLANVNDAPTLTQILCECCDAFHLVYNDIERYLDTVSFYVGRDTRPSGSLIVEAIQWVLSELFNVKCIDFGIVTTPQMHFYVNRAKDVFDKVCNERKALTTRCNNNNNNVNFDVDVDIDCNIMYSRIGLELYKQTISEAFTKLLSFAKCKEQKQLTTDEHEQYQNDDNNVLIDIDNNATESRRTLSDDNNEDVNISAKKESKHCLNSYTHKVTHLVVDAANGVGAIALHHLFEENGTKANNEDEITINDEERSERVKNTKQNEWKTLFKLHMVNCHTDITNMLNNECGADYAKFTGHPSQEMQNFQCMETDAFVNTTNDNEIISIDAMTKQVHKNETCAIASPPEYHYYCFDGDADRLIGFNRTCNNQTTNNTESNAEAVETTNASNYNNNKNLYNNNEANSSKQSIMMKEVSIYANKSEWSIIDGDRIAILYATMLNKWLGSELLALLQVGVVQTAYANGASKHYIENVLHLRSIITATGVKHLHKAAKELDIGVYFEANGHGTILINLERCTEIINAVPHLTDNEKKGKAEMLTALSQLVSQVCGDAINDMLLCEIALHWLQLTPNEMCNWYTEYPSVQVKVRVPNPSLITTSADEQCALTPHDLQRDIDDAVRAIEHDYTDNNCNINDSKNDNLISNTQNTTTHKMHARAFVRPSGTEPIVRVYCEASCKEACDALTMKVVRIVNKHLM